MPNDNVLMDDAELRDLIVEYGTAVLCEGKTHLPRQLRRINDRVRALLAPTQQPNYCDIHCKKFCQNSVHGMCDGPPAQQQSTEIQTDEEDRWISVNVRTPATSDFVIATNMRSITLAQYFQGNWIGMGGVTHWMPRPNMPTAASREES